MPLIILLFGALAASFALIIELLMMNLLPVSLTLEGTFSFGILSSFLLLALIEEASKYIFLLRYKKYAPYRSEPTFSIYAVLAVLFGVGFSSLEIVFASQNISMVSLSSILSTLLLHIGTSLIFISFLFSQPEQKRPLALKSSWIILVAVLLHLAYNVLIFLTAR